MSGYDFILTFCGRHPFLAFILICSAYYGWKYAWNVLKRAIRSRDIQKHGWPAAPIDADGDVITKEKA